jgi:hypothetical protein
MIEFTTKHIAKYRLKSNPNYIYSTDKICFNTKTIRVVKQILKDSTIGYVINGKFKSLDKLRKDLELIKKTTINDCPF